MGRTPGPSPDTRNRILSAAAAALSTKGYSKTHLADIAERADLQPPAVYYYFASREELITAVMREGQRMVRDHVQAEIVRASPSPPAVRVAAAIEAHLRLELEMTEFASAVTRNAGQLPPHIRAELDEESAAFHDIWRALLKEAESDGSLRPEIDPSVGRMLVIGALNWAADWYRPDLSIDTVVSTTQLLVDRALFVTPGSC